MNSLILILYLLPIFNTYNTQNLRENTEVGLHKVINFINSRFYEFHFDGLLGVTFAEAQLRNTLELPFGPKTRIIALVRKCQSIHNEIFPLLPDHPQYMTNFRNKLLNARKWSKLLKNNFGTGQLEILGVYKNWTVDDILKNKKAEYKGVKSDVCLREILEKSSPNNTCYVSEFCKEMMLDVNRVDTGYLLTHRLLYLQVIKLQECTFPNKQWALKYFSRKFCSYIYKEARTQDLLGYPYHDLFLEEVVLCGMEGYAEFLNRRWLNEILKWQNPYGCYESTHGNVRKRTSFITDFGCSDHATGLGAAALALNLRYLLWSNI